ncbi:MAG TPA: cation diffusion facilitator family transporter, partial [bacterium]|nr:cation diffusion facilitator family transporter [bacterium]
QVEARRAAAVTLAAIFALMVAKGVAGLLLHSIALTAEALHTLLDLATAFLAFLTIRAAQAPPDDEHPYGHGKIENLMALAQALTIMAPAVGIGYYSTVHLLRGEYGFDVRHSSLGIATMALTMAINYGLMAYLQGVAKRTGSASIRANATHERVDLITSAIVLGGFGVIAITRQPIWDPLMGIASAVYIFYEGWELLYDAAQVLLDRAAPPQLQDRIVRVLERHRHFIRDYSKVRTRVVGQGVFVDVDIQVCGQARLEDVHRLTDHLEDELAAAVPAIDAHIHPEPCPGNCADCPLKGGHFSLYELYHRHTAPPA